MALHLLDGCENVKVNWPEPPKISINTGNSGNNGNTTGGWSHDFGDAGMLTPTPTQQCTLPQHHDDYAGFAIGQPAGWLVGSGTGTIVVEKDQKGLTGALVYPARVRKADVSADHFADYFATALGRSIAKRGGSFQLTNKVTDGHIARADATATISGVKLRGPLEVHSQPGFVTLKLYWAPEESFAAEEPTLKQIVGCFHRGTLVTAKHPTAPPSSGHHAGGSSLPLGFAVAEPSTHTAGLKPFQTKFFTGKMPDGWKVKGESANGIDIIAADGSAGVGYGWVQGAVTVPSTTVRQAVARYYPTAHVVWQGPLRGPGPGWVGYGVEFESDVAHGYWQSFRNSAISVDTNVVVAKARWDAEKKMLTEVGQSMQMNQTAVNTVNAQIRAQMALVPRASPPAPSASASSASSSGMSDWQHDQDVKDRIYQGWSDSILDQERAVSPTTGEEYIVPTSAWNSSGAQGAGYYREVPGGTPELLETPPAPSE